MTMGVSIVHFVIKVPKFGSNYFYHIYSTGLSTTYCQSKMAAAKFSYFDISTSDRGDFPRIIEIALFIIGPSGRTVSRVTSEVCPHVIHIARYH